jgi:four helix bundle protein
MIIKRFEDVIAWQKAQELAVAIHILFGNINNYGFQDQICRASVSVSNNIAEGFERKGPIDFRRFLIYSLGSCSEVKSMLHLAIKLRYKEKAVLLPVIEQCTEISKILIGLIKSLKN